MSHQTEMAICAPTINERLLLLVQNKQTTFYQLFKSAFGVVFNIGVISIDKVVEVEEYYDLDTWDNLREYYKSDLKIPRPTKQFMKPYIFERERLK